MPENSVETVDSVDAQAMVDSEAATEANPSMEDSSPAKTFTLEEVDAVIKKRIDKQNAKHKSETDEMGQRISDLERLLQEKTTEAEQLKVANSRSEWAKAAHVKHSSVPEDVLTHEFVSCRSAEEVEAFAAFLSEKFGAASVFKPNTRDTGDPKSPKQNPNAGFVRELFNRED